MSRITRRWAPRLIVLSLALLAASCGRSGSGALEVAIIGGKGDPFETGARLSPAAQHIRAATAEGLVSLDAEGRVIPALADRWIITDDGRSYIFRLRDGTWPDGSELTGESARDSLRRAIRRLSGTSLARDLSQIDEVRAMAGRVVEIRLKGPMPDFLQLVAQPELGLVRRNAGSGPMTLRRVEDTAVLAMMPPEKRGLPVVQDWQKSVREVRVRALPAALAINRFDEGEVDLVLNGRIESLPLADTGPLSRGTVRLDPAVGLFGLLVVRAEGLLADASGREAVTWGVEPPTLIAPFNVGGWTPTTRVVAPGLPSDLGTIGERWGGLTLAQRRAAASARVSIWRAANDGKPAELSVEMPEGPGSDLLFSALFADMAKIGVTLKRAGPGEAASLVMIDRVARYANAQWFLNQFRCGLQRAVCSSEADRLVDEAMTVPGPAERAAVLAEAEAELTQANAYIPFGPPIRFSLVRAGVTGYADNQWVFHTLPALASLPK